jgi:hypothetical protein
LTISRRKRSTRCAAALERLRQYASWYVDRGYAGLILDSFAPRGVSRCIGDQPTPLARAFDAYRALEYLAALGSIDPGRAVPQGHSHGGATVLTTLDQITVEMAGTLDELRREHRELITLPRRAPASEVSRKWRRSMPGWWGRRGSGVNVGDQATPARRRSWNGR